MFKVLLNMGDMGNFESIALSIIGAKIYTYAYNQQLAPQPISNNCNCTAFDLQHRLQEIG